MFHVKQFLQRLDAVRFSARILDAELKPNNGCSISKLSPSRSKAVILARLCSTR
jgi:hypothetical protein